MNEKNDLVLFYILPYTKRYDSGGYYRNDDTGCTAYRPPSETVWTGNPLIFDKKEQLLKWFYENAGNPIPTVYRMKYIANYKGLNDVIKITNLGNGETKYYTALSKDKYAWYDTEKSERFGNVVWDYGYLKHFDNRPFKFDYIYEEFCKRGIKIKCNVYDSDIDKTDCFEFVGDPDYEKEKAKGKKLILYRPSFKSFW